MGKLTTHVLDLSNGIPAIGMRIHLRSTSSAPEVLQEFRTNADGRIAHALLDGDALLRGRYTLAFHVAEYFRASGTQVAEIPFLDVVNIDFGIADPQQNYHVPLLVTPWSYSTYRGS